jgi:hypothetical protein
MTEIRVSVPLWLSDALEALSHQRGVSVSELVRHVLFAYVERFAPRYVPRLPDLSDKDTPVAHLVNNILFNAITEGAEDVRIAPGGDGSVEVTHLRSGQPVVAESWPAHLESALLGRLKVMAYIPDVMVDLPGNEISSGTFSVTSRGKEYEVEISCHRVDGRQSAQLRIKNAAQEPPMPTGDAH